MASALRALSVCLAICWSVASIKAAPAQRGDVRNRDIYVSAVDRQGAPVTGLTAADFVVKEDGAAREVLAAKPATEPMQIAVLIDDSSAASDATSFLREGLLAFLERMRGHAEIGLITVGERPTVLAAYTSDTEVLNDKVKRLFPRANSGAYLLDAISEASKALAKREAARPVILAITFEGTEYSN